MEGGRGCPQYYYLSFTVYATFIYIYFTQCMVPKSEKSIPT